MTRFAPTPLVGGGLTLRPLVEDDIDAVARACDDEEIRRWLMLPVPYTRADAHAFVTRMARDVLAADTGVVFAIDDGTGFVGSVDLKGTDWSNLSTEVGYLVAPWARGRGLAAAATRLLAEWAIRARHLERVELRAAAGNVASVRAAERAGFTFEGTARNAGAVRDGRVDFRIYSLVSGDL